MTTLAELLMGKVMPPEGEVTDRGAFLPLGTYRRSDGTETTSLAFPQPMRDGLDALAYALGYRQDPQAPQGFASHDALNKGGASLAESAMVGGLAAPKPANALAMGIKAYHGSPHKFDKFSMNKIGTGEGNQTYGHGLYFAENEAVARDYKRALGGMVDLEPINKRLSEIAREKSAIESGYNKPRSGFEEQHKALTDEYTALMDRRSNLGQIYQVDIDADPQQFLDWDKPLGEQSEAVRKALADYEPEWQIPDLIRHRMSLDARTALDAEGGDISRGAADRRVSEMLRDRGIAGIRYLDQGSRASGEGSHNYVVFDDNLITIEDILAASPMAGAVPIMFDDPDQRRQMIARHLMQGGA